MRRVQWQCVKISVKALFFNIGSPAENAAAPKHICRMIDIMHNSVFVDLYVFNKKQVPFLASKNKLDAFA